MPLVTYSQLGLMWQFLLLNLLNVMKVKFQESKMLFTGRYLTVLLAQQDL